MSVEILTVSLSDESVERIAQRVAQLTAGGAASYSPVGSPGQTPQPAQSPGPSQQGDPWANTPVAAYSQQQAQPQQQYQQAPQQAPPQPTQYQQQGQAPVCAHGPMRFVQAGVSGSGKAYGAFWGCSAPRGANQCKSVRL